MINTLNIHLDFNKVLFMFFFFSVIGSWNTFGPASSRKKEDDSTRPYECLGVPKNLPMTGGVTGETVVETGSRKDYGYGGVVD